MYFSDITPQEQSEWWFYEKNVIDESTICKIENYLEGKDLISNQEMNDVYNKNIRSSEIYWMHQEGDEDELMPIYTEVVYKMRQINDCMWKYRVNGWEPFQYSQYDESYSGHFNWHIDVHPKFNVDDPDPRKISFSVGLSNINDYDGGDFMIKIDINEKVFKLDRGDVIAFPSWMLHKVSPVTRGMRRTLVGWGNGPLL
tara:strand:- start:1081 stop:1677 length:597 start_codon:yes stop_codon:yes gene_type:complete